MSSMAFAIQPNETEDLSSLVVGYSGIVYAIQPIPQGAIFGGDNGQLVFYNKTSNTTINLTGTDEGNWLDNDLIQGKAIFGLDYDGSNRVYISTSENGNFGYYDFSDGITYKINTADILFDIGAEGGIVFDSARNGLWLLGFGESNDAGNNRLFFYDIALNTTTNYSNYINPTTFSNGYDMELFNDKLYLSGGGGGGGIANLISFNILTNTTDILSNVGIQLMSIDVASNNNAIYIGEQGGDIIYYDISLNTTTLIENIGATNGGGQFKGVDGNNNRFYYARDNTISFKRYDKTTDSIVQLNVPATFDFGVFSLSYDSINNGVYIGGSASPNIFAFAYYQAFPSCDFQCSSRTETCNQDTRRTNVCTAVTEQNGCGEDYLGDFSEFDSNGCSGIQDVLSETGNGIGVMINAIRLPVGQFALFLSIIGGVVALILGLVFAIKTLAGKHI